ETAGEILLRALEPVAQALLEAGKQRHRLVSVACRLAYQRWGPTKWLPDPHPLLRWEDDPADDGAAGAERRQGAPVQLERDAASVAEGEHEGAVRHPLARLARRHRFLRAATILGPHAHPRRLEHARDKPIRRGHAAGGGLDVRQ